MLLPPEEVKQLLHLYTTLLGFAARELGGVAGVTDLLSWQEANLTAKAKVRDALFTHPQLIDSYLAQNPDGCTDEEREILVRWKGSVRQLCRPTDLKRHTVFLTTKEPYVAYGVLGLTTEIADLLPVPLPALADSHDATLLPWKGLIVCDGLVTGYRIVLGSGYRRSFRGMYRETTSQRGIVTSLELPDEGSQQRVPLRPRRLSRLERFLKSCPDTVIGFKERYGEPRLEMGNKAATEYGPWRLDGTPALKADYLIVHPERPSSLCVLRQGQHYSCQCRRSHGRGRKTFLCLPGLSPS